MHIFRQLAYNPVIEKIVPLVIMQLEPGFIFQDPLTGFTWKISQPWISRWQKRQIGWICTRAGFHPLQDPMSQWKECDIINRLKPIEQKKPR